MPHVSGSDLEAHAALTPDAAAALALQLVEAAICPGVPDVLTRREREITLEPYVAQLTGGPGTWRRRISCNALGAWPVTGLVSARAGDQDITATVEVSTFALYWRGYSTPHRLTIRYVTGYTDGELPAPLKAAVVQLGSKLLEGELDVSRISWGEGVSTTYVGATAEVLPKSVLDLIAPWQFTSFG